MKVAERSGRTQPVPIRSMTGPGTVYEAEPPKGIVVKRLKTLSHGSVPKCPLPKGTGSESRLAGR
jgi:hypothetical protein